MDVQAMQAAARARLQQSQPQMDTFVDPTQPQAIPIIVQRVVPKVERPTQATFVLEANQASFAAMLPSGKKIMFVNYRFETEAGVIAEQLIREYAPRVWRV